jgi:hypothetical protein
MDKACDSEMLLCFVLQLEGSFSPVRVPTPGAAAGADKVPMFYRVKLRKAAAAEQTSDAAKAVEVPKTVQIRCRRLLPCQQCQQGRSSESS